MDFSGTRVGKEAKLRKPLTYVRREIILISHTAVLKVVGFGMDFSG